MKKLPAVCPPAPKHAPSRYERVLPATPKSGRHPLAQQWRDDRAKNQLYAPSTQLTPTHPMLLLSAPIQPLLLTAGAEYSACQAIAEFPDGMPDVLFLHEFGAVTMSNLLSAGKIRVKEEKVFISTEPQPAPSMAEMVAKVEAAPDTTREVATLDIPLEPRTPVVAEPTPTPAPVEPPKRVSPVAPIFKTLPSNQNLNPLGNAVVEKQMKLNTSTAFSLASSITDDANAAHKWLRVRFSIQSGSMITADKLAEVQKAVTEEQLLFANPTTIATLNAWGMAVVGGTQWYNGLRLQTKRHSADRTQILSRLYQVEAEVWIKELQKKATQEQVLEAGKRMDAMQARAQNFGKRPVH